VVREGRPHERVTNPVVLERLPHERVTSAVALPYEELPGCLLAPQACEFLMERHRRFVGINGRPQHDRRFGWRGLPHNLELSLNDRLLLAQALGSPRNVNRFVPPL
jgi:hypothetical protein